MTLFSPEIPKKDLNFEFRNFHPFYDELSKSKRNRNIEEDQKIVNAFKKGELFFNQYPDIKNNLMNQRNLKVNNVLDECEKFIKEVSNPEKDILRKIVKQDLAARWLVCFGERLGGYCAISSVSSSQLRNVFGQIKSLEMRMSNLPAENEIDALSLRKMQLLIPRLAYAAKREGGGLIQLSDVLTTAIKLVETVGDFMRFSQFFEATLAYHKAYGGK